MWGIRICMPTFLSDLDTPSYVPGGSFRRIICTYMHLFVCENFDLYRVGGGNHGPKNRQPCVWAFLCPSIRYHSHSSLRLYFYYLRSYWGIHYIPVHRIWNFCRVVQHKVYVYRKVCVHFHLMLIMVNRELFWENGFWLCRVQSDDCILMMVILGWGCMLQLV